MPNEMWENGEISSEGSQKVAEAFGGRGTGRRNRGGWIMEALMWPGRKLSELIPPPREDEAKDAPYDAGNLGENIARGITGMRSGGPGYQALAEMARAGDAEGVMSILGGIYGATNEEELLARANEELAMYGKPAVSDAGELLELMLESPDFYATILGQ